VGGAEKQEIADPKGLAKRKSRTGSDQMQPTMQPHRVRKPNSEALRFSALRRLAGAKITGDLVAGDNLARGRTSRLGEGVEARRTEGSGSCNTGWRKRKAYAGLFLGWSGPCRVACTRVLSPLNWTGKEGWLREALFQDVFSERC